VLNAIDPKSEQQIIQKHMEAVKHKAVVPVQSPEESKTFFKKLKSYFPFGLQWFSSIPLSTVTKLFGLLMPAEGSDKEGIQKKRDHKMVPGREGEEFRDEIIRKDDEGEDIDIYSDTRRGPLVWEKLSAGDPEDPPEVCIMIEQPKRGTDISLTGSTNMGHAMIGLSYSRYNKATGKKERYQLRMGFWPKKYLGKMVGDIPMVSGAVVNGTLEDDDTHDYNIALKYQVKPGDINKILKESEKYADKGYAYFKRNCTTFAVDMAKTINLPIVKELKKEEMKFDAVGGTLINMGKFSNHPGITAMAGNNMASKMNKMDLSYQNFGQKMVTKEDMDRFYKSWQYGDDESYGYAPGPVGEQLRNATTGELSVLNEEDRELDLGQIQEKMRNLGVNLALAIEKETPKAERNAEYDAFVKAVQIEDDGLNNLIMSGKYTSSDLRECHKNIRNAARTVSAYYKNRLKSKASFCANIMSFLSRCEVMLTITDQAYRKIISKEVKGDAGTWRYDFANTEKEFTFYNEENDIISIMVKPGVFEGYLMAGKTADEAVKEIGRRNELLERKKAAERQAERQAEAEENVDENENENAEEPVQKLTKEEMNELGKLNRIYDLASNFASANRYILEKDSFDEKDVRYAFKELPAMEKGSGPIKSTAGTMVNSMPSAAYQAVIFESLLGGIRELSLDEIKNSADQFAALDQYLAEGFKAKPELAGMILKNYVESEGIDKPVNDLIQDFLDRFINICLIPPYEGTKFTIGHAGNCVVGLASADSAFNKYLTEQFEQIKKNAANMSS
jgi:hypothetical protein